MRHLYSKRHQNDLLFPIKLSLSTAINIIKYNLKRTFNLEKIALFYKWDSLLDLNLGLSSIGRLWSEDSVLVWFQKTLHNGMKYAWSYAASVWMLFWYHFLSCSLNSARSSENEFKYLPNLLNIWKRSTKLDDATLL